MFLHQRLRYLVRYAYWAIKHRSTEHVAWVLDYEGRHLAGPHQTRAGGTGAHLKGNSMTTDTTATAPDGTPTWELLLKDDAVLLLGPNEKVGVYATNQPGIVIMAEDEIAGLRHIPIDIEHGCRSCSA